MSVFPFLHFFNTIVYLYLAVYIFIKNPKALLNRLCAAFLVCFSLWSFSFIFIHNPITTKNIARLFVDISSFGWVSFSSFFLWFILAFTRKKEILKKKWFYILLFVIPLLFIYKQWTNHIFVDITREYYGWRGLYSSSIWPYLFFFYYLSFMGAGIYFSIDFMRKTRSPTLKKQAKVVVVTMIIPLISGTLTDVIFTLSNIHIIPNIADSFVLIWAFGVVYAMVKYKFLAITPALAASNIISTMFDSLILLNMKGEIEYINKAGLKLLGYKDEELKGVSLSVLFSEQDKKNISIEQIISEGNLKNRDYVLRTKKGENIPVLFSSSILRDEAGTAGGLVCVARDISERKKLEEEVLKSKKLEALGILAGGMAHDFNNLLSGIMGNIALVQNILGAGEKKQEFLKKAEEASLKAANLAGRFITFSSGGWLNKKEIILSNILKNISDSGLPGENIDYEINIPADLSPIYADEEQLNQLFENLLINASEAMPGGGRISLRAENVTIKVDNKLPIKTGKYVKVVINDNGIGIPAENIEKIFDPYFSTKERMSRKGIGLGLTVCYSIVKKHGGYIFLESKEGQGTTVILYFPVS